MKPVHRIRVLDSHTGGEPTRLVIEGGPDLGSGPLGERIERFHEQFDRYRSAVVNEPRGSDPVVGALLVEPHDPTCQFGVLFFNNVGTLGMCGHGTIGVVVSLAYLQRLEPGPVRIDTPVGPVTARLHAHGAVSVQNVPSWRASAGVRVALPGGEIVTGDIAWGGNWFFIAEERRLALDRGNLEALTRRCREIRAAVNAQGHPEVDHIELWGPSISKGVDARNFVLCPGGAYDRSPCGTGTSAKVACLAADRLLAEGEEWSQESVVGSVFRATYRRDGDRIVPTITGTAHVCAEATLLLDPSDLFCWGIR